MTATDTATFTGLPGTVTGLPETVAHIFIPLCPEILSPDAVKQWAEDKALQRHPTESSSRNEFRRHILRENIVVPYANLLIGKLRSACRNQDIHFSGPGYSRIANQIWGVGLSNYSGMINIIFEVLELDPDTTPVWIESRLRPGDTAVILMTAEQMKDCWERLQQDAFIRISQGRSLAHLHKLERELTMTQNHLNDLMRDYTHHVRQLRGLRQTFEAVTMSVSLDDEPARLAAELERIRNYYWVEAVTLTTLEDNTIQVEVYTTDVSIDWGGWTFYLGRYQIVIDTNRDRIRIFSHEPNRDGYQHPHVNPDGGPCFGDFGLIIAEAMGGSHIDVTAQTIWEFLNHYNPDDPFCRIDVWDDDYVPDDYEDDSDEDEEPWDDDDDDDRYE